MGFLAVRIIDIEGNEEGLFLERTDANRFVSRLFNSPKKYLSVDLMDAGALARKYIKNESVRLAVNGANFAWVRKKNKKKRSPAIQRRKENE